VSQIERVGVVGAGQMGRGIAQVAAQAKLVVSLHDASSQALDEGIARIRADLERLVQRQRLPAAEVSAILARIRPAPALSGLADSPASSPSRPPPRAWR
jgi:3-hydroxybutyryl-CoA dehydrogenase